MAVLCYPLMPAYCMFVYCFTVCVFYSCILAEIVCRLPVFTISHFRVATVPQSNVGSESNQRQQITVCRAFRYHKKYWKWRDEKFKVTIYPFSTLMDMFRAATHKLQCFAYSKTRIFYIFWLGC